MEEFSWKHLIDSKDTLLGLKSDRQGMKNWINGIIQRINAIDDDKEAIRILFVINQKIGVVKGKKDSHYYPTELYDRLQITVNKLLEKRLSGNSETISKTITPLEEIEELIESVNKGKSTLDTTDLEYFDKVDLKNLDKGLQDLRLGINGVLLAINEG